MSDHETDEAYFKIEDFAKDMMNEYMKIREMKGEDKIAKLAVIYDVLAKMKTHGLIRGCDISTGEIFL